MSARKEPDPRLLLARSVREADLQANVLALARALGYRRVHFRPAQDRRGRWATHQAGDAGFPDTVLARPGRLIFAELKSIGGRLAPEQDEWLRVLKAAGVEAYVWDPRHWLSGEIERTLTGTPPLFAQA